jgi:hypothetical protein
VPVLLYYQRPCYEERYKVGVLSVQFLNNNQGTLKNFNIKVSRRRERRKKRCKKEEDEKTTNNE